MNRTIIVALTLGLLLACNSGEKITYAEIETEYGSMKVELFNSTPQHRDNFIKLAKEGFYKDLLFHRVMPGFMVQGGDPDSRNAAPGQQLGRGGPGYTIAAEIGEIHVKGALAAARMPDNVNPQRASSGSQFYVVQGGTITEQQLDFFENSGNFKYEADQRSRYLNEGGYPGLDNQYSVFGRVVEGLEVIDQIAAVDRDPANRPLKDVRMKVRILN